jgi:PhzF family phenazine biosynthesis protein
MTPVVCLQIDAFADRPYSGNPAAVCLLDEERDSQWMQAVAREMNLSETAFVRPTGDGFDLRWFTPAVEVDLCGHATLAAAHALWSEGRAPGDDEIRFQTRSGVLTASRRGGLIELDFPATAPGPAQLAAEQVTALCEALGVEPDSVARSVFDLLVVVGSEDTVRGLRPDFARLKELAFRGVRLEVFCARRRHRRGSRHRFGALLPRPVLERTAGQDQYDGLPGVVAGWCRSRSRVKGKLTRAATG